MKYSFSEKSLGQNFHAKIIKELKATIQQGISCTLLGMPLCGMVTLCRYLATTDIAYFAYIDTQSLKHKTRNDLFLSLYNELEGHNVQQATVNAFEECKKQLRQLIGGKKRIVILIARLDYLKEELSTDLLADFKTLADIGVGRIVFIGTSRIPLHQINTSALVTSNPSFMTDGIYFTPVQGEDFKKLYNFLPGKLKASQKNINNIFELSGGHLSLVWQLLKTNQIQNPLTDNIVKLQLETIYNEYFPQQKSQLRKIAAGKKVNNLDPFLLKIGLVKKIGEKYELFTPLLRDYILQYVQTKMSRKEKLLFSLLKKKTGKIVTKEEIFENIWGDASDQATDWALNSLIYRLRKNPNFSNKNYIIENEKDQGYRMIKER